VSFIVVPDPHPGRCKNYRSVTHNDGHVEPLRCLDYEAVPHQCTFPGTTHISNISNVGRWNSTTTFEHTSIPWKKPGGE
jgi:hypothetical protein